MATPSTSNADTITTTQGPQNPERNTAPRNGQDIEKQDSIKKDEPKQKF
jgi:hypothetical protein